MCVYVCVCCTPTAQLKNLPWGSVLAKREPRTQARYELAEKGWVRQTVWEKRKKINKHRYTKSIGRRLVWDLTINKHKTGDNGQKLCGCTVAVLNFLTNLFSSEFRIQAFFLQSSSAENMKLPSHSFIACKTPPFTPLWTPRLQPIKANRISSNCTDMWSDSALVWVQFLCHTDPGPFPSPGKWSSRRLTHAQRIPER